MRPLWVIQYPVQVCLQCHAVQNNSSAPPHFVRSLLSGCSLNTRRRLFVAECLFLKYGSILDTVGQQYEAKCTLICSCTQFLFMKGQSPTSQDPLSRSHRSKMNCGHQASGTISLSIMFRSSPVTVLITSHLTLCGWWVFCRLVIVTIRASRHISSLASI